MERKWEYRVPVRLQTAGRTVCVLSHDDCRNRSRNSRVFRAGRCGVSMETAPSKSAAASVRMPRRAQIAPRVREPEQNENRIWPAVWPICGQHARL